MSYDKLRFKIMSSLLAENQNYSLFSTILSLYVLLLLYSPSPLIRFIFSPVILSTFILLLYLLRLGAHQNSAIGGELTINSIEESDRESDYGMGSDPSPFYEDSFVEWDVRAPLEVIYEEYEGEDAEDDKQANIIQRYASLSLFYPESDTDASSEGDDSTNGDWGSPENICYRWEEDDREGNLIEIELDEKRNSHHEVDQEENLIEIELSPTSDFRRS